MPLERAKACGLPLVTLICSSNEFHPEGDIKLGLLGACSLWSRYGRTVSNPASLLGFGDSHGKQGWRLVLVVYCSAFASRSRIINV